MQPVPQLALQLFFESQWYVTLFGCVELAPPSPVAPPSAVVAGASPNVQVPPALHVHSVVVHEQSPVHEGAPLCTLCPLLLPHPADSDTARPTIDSALIHHEVRTMRHLMDPCCRARMQEG